MEKRDTRAVGGGAIAEPFQFTFRVPDDNRFSMLVAAFDALREAKKRGDAPDAEGPYWKAFFDEEALARFCSAGPMPPEKWWAGTASKSQQFAHLVVSQWDFASMIDAILSGEYDLLLCEKTSPEEGRLTFDPHAWPYCGNDSLRALIEAFDCAVIGSRECE